MTTLHLMLTSVTGADARGLFWPASGNDPATTELVGWEQDMDEWNGDDIVSAADPWFLATAALCQAITDAGLTGLRVGIAANVSYSDSGKVLAGLGELAARELPEFRIVVPERAVDVRALNGPDDGIRRYDDLRYDGWTGDDFAYCTWGAVLTKRALSLLKAYRVIGSQFWPVEPRVAE
jgi:hypothetical protein